MTQSRLPALPVRLFRLETDIRLYGLDLSVLSDAALFEACYRAMPEERKQKIDRMRFAEGKRQSLGAGALLSYALTHCGLDDLSYAVTADPNGKPRIEPLYDRFRFNLSHTGDRAFCAVSFSPEGKAREVGCDVEHMTGARYAVAERFFAPEEAAMLLATSNEEAKRDTFFCLWTLKESFIKATGLGFHCPLNSFRLGFGEEGTVSIYQTVTDGRFSFWEKREGDYRYACCVKTDEGAEPEAFEACD